MTIYDTRGQPPPIPDQFPHTIRYFNGYAVREHTVRDLDAYYGFLFWHFVCQPAGPTGLHPSDTGRNAPLSEPVYPTDTP